MKNNIIAFAALLFLSFSVHAQIDRSKQPKAGPAPKINIDEPESFKLDNGLTVMVVENHKLPRVSMSLRLDNPPIFEDGKAGVSSLTGQLLGTGTQNMSKDDFNERVDFLGARLNFYSSGANANTLSKYFPEVLKLMADGAINPKFTEEEFSKVKDREIEGLKSNEKNVAYNAGRVRSALAYGKNHPYGEFATEATVGKLTLADAQSFYDTYFVPQNAYLVIVGDVDEDEVKKLVKENFSNWKKKDLPAYKMPTVSNLAQTEIQFVDMPNAVQSEIALVNTINLKQKDEDYFAVLVANKILGGGGEARLFLNLREDKGYTYGAYSRTGNDKYSAATFVASASVRNAVTDSSVVAFLDEIYRIRNEKVSDSELANAKAKYTGDFVLSLEQPATIARLALDVETEDLDDDFYEDYLENINAVTAEDVQRVAKKYFLADNSRIVVVGKGSDVVENLEKINYNGKKIPVVYFDKEGNKVDKPEFNKTVDASVTAESVFNNYIKAIGGKEAVTKAESVMMVAQAEIQGQKLDLEVKTANGKSSQKIAMGGNVLSKQVYNGETGFTMAQGQKMAFTDKQLEAAKADANPFPELNTKDAKVMGIEPVDGKDAYVVALSEDKTAYYDVESGLKVKAVSKVSQGDQTMEIPITYSDYQEVNGIKFPFTVSQSMGPQTFEFKVSDLKVNEGVSDEDFME
ncbi:M16 family metallopeptidase [Gillisia marina]|uniref:M16 family metallopeptidase n=1 Tax=Gillisia marina TaxID=1167637 RepID=UPI00029AD509|nr:pitrilysin family protein [Gillisia marina]